MCDSEGLSLAPRGKDNLRELLEEVDEDLHGIGGEERDDGLSPLGVTLDLGVIIVCVCVCRQI